MFKKSELDGAWEERGVIGTRIEIKGSKVTILWRNTPALETSFKKENGGDGKIILKLKETGLRNQNQGPVYATVTELSYKDGKLEFVEDFPISGVSRATLEKTLYSRYGAYEIVDEILPELKGEWSDEKGWFKLEFSGNQMKFQGEKRKIHVLRPISGYRSEFFIADEDPSCYDFRGFSRPVYSGGVITVQMMICDAPPVVIELKKK